MGKKKAKRTQKQGKPVVIPTVEDILNKSFSQHDLDQNDRDIVDLGGASSPINLDLDFENFDDEIHIPQNEAYGVPHYDLPIGDPPKHTYKTVFMSHENVTSAAKSNETQQEPKKSSSQYSSYHELMDGGAYKQFHDSQQSLNRSRSKSDLDNGERILAGSRSISHRSLFSDRSMSAIPQNTSAHVDESVRISRENSVRVPYTRSRTVSSRMASSDNLLGIKPMSSSDDVRTYHANSDYLHNHLSKLSIHSNNDEFVLVGGHPPDVSSSSENIGKRFDDDPGRSISQQSLHGHPENGHISRSTSRHTVGTTSNTDDRLLLAARYSQSPEAEGILSIPRNDGRLSRTSSISNASERVGFSEIPTLFSHPDDKFDDDDEPGEPFRPTSEHTCTPTNVSRSRQSINLQRFSSSSTISSGNQPQKALLVTSALTPVVPKRTSISRTQSNDSVVLSTPQTVQRASDSRRPRRPSSTDVKQTVEIAIQTGDTIRMRQKRGFDVLSECAYLPDTDKFEISTMKTSSFVPVEIPKAEPATSLRSRLRHISDIYAETDATDSSHHHQHQKPIHIPIEVPVKKSVAPVKTIGKQVHIPISTQTSAPPKEPKELELTSGQVEDKTKSGDTIRKHLPRGRIRDLAEAFNRMEVAGSPVVRKMSAHTPSFKRFSQNDDVTDHPKPDYLSSTGDIGKGSSNRLDRTSSTAFKSSNSLQSQEERRRSTSSSLHHQPHVFTRNTFLTQSKSGDRPHIPSNVAMTASYASSQDVGKGDGFVSEFEKISDSSSHLPPTDKKALFDESAASQFSEYSRNVPVRLEVPIGGLPRSEKTKKRLVASGRAKTQEVAPMSFEQRYESRAVSGDLQANPVFGYQAPLFNSEAFGRATAEDLSGRQDNWSPVRPPKYSQYWERAPSNEGITGHNNNKAMPTYITTTEYEINSNKGGDNYLPHNGRFDEKKDAQPLQRKLSTSRQLYSPPATEDAGSRITHHTSTTQDDLFATEDSSIRGKIDRMFDFVESDDSRKTLRGPSGRLESHASTDTIGTSGFIRTNNNNHNFQHKQQQQPRFDHQDDRDHRFNNSRFHQRSTLKISDKPSRAELKMKSPDRRNTVTGSEIDTGLEYSLTQYREMQREQLRRRLPSADEPQFFRSPSLTAPHAGQSMHAYRTRDFLGTPTAGEKVRFPSSSSGLKHAPTALATSTPCDSPQSRTSYSQKDRFLLELNNNTNNMTVPNETFVSSISGVSAIDKHADVMRKINRLSYMIENTQQQMSMNEAALADSIKKGRRHNEIAAHRSILISRETLRLQRSELRRLHAFSAVRRPPPPMAKELRGAVVFKNLSVSLNKLFVSRLTQKDVADNSYSFVGLFKFGHQVEATELVPLRVYPGEETSDKLYFEKQIQFSDVPIDFMVSIEIYAMRVAPTKPVELSIGSSLANKCKSLMGPPQKKTPLVSTETAFKFRGRLVLDRDASGDRCFYLDDVTYPLEGTVTITTECSRLPEAFEVDFKGFLTMFHTISNMASWERYWAVLRRGIVFFWKYPEDEQAGREPRMQIDLTKCTNNSIEKCGFDLCPRAHSFGVEILVDTEDGTIGSVVEKKRVLLSADSSELLAQWLFTLNQTLDVIRGPI